MNRFEKFATHILFWIIFTLVFINLGFLFGFTISILSLPLSYILYVTIWSIIKFKKTKKKITNSYVTLAILTPLIFFFILWGFGHTFDSSYDGQSYHQSAVIELSNGWNPWYQSALPVKLIEAEPFVIGYPKALWILQSSIYKLFPFHINAATVTNLIITIIAFIFVYRLLIRLKLSRNWAIVITLLAVVQTELIQVFFSFMADGFGYEATLIALSSLMLVIVERDKKWSLCTFFSSLLLLAGTKYSNLYVFGLLCLVCTVYLIKIIRRHVYLVNIIVIFLIVGLIILWVPYGRNLMTYGSLFYPSNLKWAKDDLSVQNTPKNLKDANKFVLLFYGIYSQAQTASAADSDKNVAKLKLPFTTTLEEINITDNFQGRVGAAGVFFSGLFTISIIIYFDLLTLKKSLTNRKAFYTLSTLIGLTIVVAFVNPVPNELHYLPIFALIPVYLLVSCLLIFKEKQHSLVRKGIIVFTILISANVLFKLIPSIVSRINETNMVTREMAEMRDSHKIYQVHAKSFYSSYIRLQEYGVRFTKEDKLMCPNIQHLILSNYTTFYCP